MAKNVIVFGGSGHQGSAFIQALAAHNTPSLSWKIHLLERQRTPPSTSTASPGSSA